MMTVKPNATLDGLRQQMAGLQPGLIEGAAERVAPLATKLLGYAELVKAVLPDMRRAMDAAQRRRPAAGPRVERVAARASERVPGPEVVVVRRRGWSWQTRLLLAAIPVSAGLAAYGTWMATRRR